MRISSLTETNQFIGAWFHKALYTQFFLENSCAKKMHKQRQQNRKTDTEKRIFSVTETNDNQNHSFYFLENECAKKCTDRETEKHRDIADV